MRANGDREEAVPAVEGMTDEWVIFKLRWQGAIFKTNKARQFGGGGT